MCFSGVILFRDSLFNQSSFAFVNMLSPCGQNAAKVNNAMVFVTSFFSVQFWLLSTNLEPAPFYSLKLKIIISQFS